jgi:hypothetical protein
VSFREGNSRPRPPEPPQRLTGVAIFAVAFALRAGVAFWASERIAPVEDGRYYHIVATRIANGLGYTWLWPDGSVSYAAHYPVGYPALVGACYSIFGPHPCVAMLLNAVLGSLAAVAALHIAESVASPRAGLVAGAMVALHPALVAYTPALMTEGVTAALLIIAGWLALRIRSLTGGRRGLGLAALAALLGITLLVRPQCLLLVPIYGALAIAGSDAGAWRARGLSAAFVTCLAVGVCLPWTMRNCARMGHCVFVSANGGWNLLIGTAADARGTWAPIEKVGVPEECRTEFREAFKDACFGKSAASRIRHAPLRWLTLVPAKLSATFDYSGAPGWYLHASNPSAFPFNAKVVLGVLETVSERGLLALALLALGRRAGRRQKLRQVLAAAAAFSLLTPLAWPAYLMLTVIAALLGPELISDPPALLAASAVFATALTHAVFFGAGRYSMPCFPLIASLAGTLRPSRLTRLRAKPSRLSTAF